MKLKIKNLLIIFFLLIFLIFIINIIFVWRSSYWEKPTTELSLEHNRRLNETDDSNFNNDVIPIIIFAFQRVNRLKESMELIQKYIPKTGILIIQN
jgi:hypothetical protein